MVTIPSVSPARKARYAALGSRRGAISSPFAAEAEVAKKEAERKEQVKLTAEIKEKETKELLAKEKAEIRSTTPIIPTPTMLSVVKTPTSRFQQTRKDLAPTYKYEPEPEYYTGEGKISRYSQLKSTVFGEGEGRRITEAGIAFGAGAGGVVLGTGKFLVVDIPKSIYIGTTGKLFGETMVGTVESVGATIKDPTPRGLGQLTGIAATSLVFKGAGKIGTATKGVAPRIALGIEARAGAGAVITRAKGRFLAEPRARILEGIETGARRTREAGRVDVFIGDARTIAFKEGDLIKYGTEADVTLIKKGLIKDKTFEGKVRVKGETAELIGGEGIQIKTRAAADILATEGRKTLSEFKFESEIAGKKKVGKGFELGVEFDKGKIAGVSAIEFGGKVQPPVKSISMVSKAIDVPSRVTKAGVFLPESKAFKVYGLARRTEIKPIKTGFKQTVEVFEKPKAEPTVEFIRPEGKPITELKLTPDKPPVTVSGDVIKSITETTAPKIKIGFELGKVSEVYAKEFAQTRPVGTLTLGLEGKQKQLPKERLIYDVPIIRNISLQQTGQFQTPFTTTAQATGQYGIQIDKQLGKQTELFKETGAFDTPAGIVPPPTPTTIMGGMFLPKKERLAFIFAPTKFKSPTFAPKYVPSVEALAFDIRGIQPSAKEVSMGIKLRPKKRRKK